MAANSYINIDFPFKNSPDGFFINLNSSDDRAIKADLMHLLLTRKGQRLYNPNFGTNLMRYIFEPNDSLTLTSIKEDVTATVRKYLPNLSITNLSVTQSNENNYVAVIRVDYTVTDNVFESNDFVIIKV